MFVGSSARQRSARTGGSARVDEQELARLRRRANVFAMSAMLPSTA